MADIKIKDLTYYYPEQEKAVLQGINLHIEEGQFVLIVGSSGCGKSTLLRSIAGLVPDFYGGRYSGEVLIDDIKISSANPVDRTSKVGIVFQDPESQLVMTTVEGEMVFGMENLGEAQNLMKRRVMEVTGALSLSELKSGRVTELSGGQKQKVALASVLAMQPEVIVMDEPTSQLDPIAGEDILTMIRRLNEENGMTVILTEQKLERCYHFADRIIIVEDGRVALDSDDLSKAALWAAKHQKAFVPPLMEVFGQGFFGDDGKVKIPVTVKEGRTIIKKLVDTSMRGIAGEVYKTKEGNPNWKKRNDTVLKVENLWFTYPNGVEVMKNFNLSLEKGGFTVLMGENGSGKTTLFKNIMGLLKPDRGRITVGETDIRKLETFDIGKLVGYLSQDPRDYLFLPTVKEEIEFGLSNQGIKDDKAVHDIMKQLDILKYSEKNPRDLSIGEQQRVALATVLVMRPKVLLLDEPTRGLDYELKEALGNLLGELRSEGVAILMIAHDVEFVAEYSEEVVLISDGQVVAKGSKYEMLSDSTFYSPQMARLFKGYTKGVVTKAQGLKVLDELIVKEEVS